MIIDLLNLAKYVVWLYTWAVIISALLMTLTSFGVLDTRNRAVWTINDFFYRVTEPALRPIRNVLPSFGGVDLSPLVLILLLWFVQSVIGRMAIALESGSLYNLFL